MLAAAHGVLALPRFGELKDALAESVRTVVPRSVSDFLLDKRQSSNSSNSNSATTTDVWVLEDEFSGQTFFE